jgi:hypothetical protein
VRAATFCFLRGDVLCSAGAAYCSFWRMSAIGTGIDIGTGVGRSGLVLGRGLFALLLVAAAAAAVAVAVAGEEKQKKKTADGEYPCGRQLLRSKKKREQKDSLSRPAAVC